MAEYFAGIPTVVYEGPESDNPLAFKHYDAEAVVAGKTMKDHLRFAASYWHCMKGAGADPFGVGTREMPWLEAGDAMTAARQTMDAMFEFIGKIGVPYWCFHDRDIAPELDDLGASNKALDEIVDQAESLQQATGVKLLWGTACLFIHPRFMAGAGTSPSADVFAHGAAQVKKAMEVTHRLGGEGYVFWGGREGYDTLLNTDLRRETENMARLLRLAVDYKKEIGFTGQFYIEPKPKEPTTHQYDFDAQSCHAFLLQHGLEKDFKLNIEANHATLAGHSFHHDLEYAAINGLLGSIDANRGDLLIGWDTDQFPTNLYDTAMAMLTLLRAGGFTTGGLNFDAKVRRQSTEPVDLVYAHIGGMDAFARGLKIAAAIIADGKIDGLVKERYVGWENAIGKKIESGQATMAELEAHALKTNVMRAPVGRQELLENLLNEYL
ncbi:xylose isomerase [Mucisphaera calidilacus]|uniref:Xylose isomerase n=1 Tax=Mucisphaera calidilacus TaxID=2527982 RepID=A0A518BZ39_9BACT|nr:xylose isomerase [Mucisphaera calidilacus]QDU72235.1 Xylose isomerase [Mucisphaera calidilacus]